MGRNTRERALLETRERLLEVADRHFADQGYADTKIEGIATRAGFTRGAFYQHFSSKEELFFAVWDRRAAKQRSEWLNLEQGAGQGWEGLAQWYEMNVERQQGFAAAANEFIAFASRRPELLHRLREREADLIETLAGLLPDHTSDSLDPAEIAAIVLAVGEGLAAQLTHSSRSKAELFAAAVARVISPPLHDGGARVATAGGP